MTYNITQLNFESLVSKITHARLQLISHNTVHVVLNASTSITEIPRNYGIGNSWVKKTGEGKHHVIIYHCAGLYNNKFGL